MVPQPTLPRLRPPRRRPHRDPQPKRASLPLQALWPDLLRHQGHRPLQDAQAYRVGFDGGDPPGLRLPGASHRRRLLPRRTNGSRWQREAGSQCRRVHEHFIEVGRVQLLQVQADELRVKAVGGIFWLACALEVRSRLWLGGVISESRDRGLIRSVFMRVRECGSVSKVLLVTDGLASYARQALRIFREPLRTGKRGRPRLVLPEGVMVARVKKRYQRRRVVEVIREVVRGTEGAVHSRLQQTQHSAEALINTAYIERLNATFRAQLAPLVRRTRAGAHKRSTLEAGMWLVGSCYNLLWVHRSLGEGCTPAMAARITDHRWTMEELLTFPVVPAELPTWRGRKPGWLLEAERAA